MPGNYSVRQLEEIRYLIYYITKSAAARAGRNLDSNKRKTKISSKFYLRKTKRKRQFLAKKRKSASMVAVEDVLGVNCHRGAICLINYFSFQIYLNKNKK
jgi:hypothetical protein